MLTTTEIPDVHDAHSTDTSADTRIQIPDMSHAADMWRIARDSGTLDLNSSYAYLLYCRDFPATCRIAVADGEVVGFVLANVPPERPDRVFVWQIAVDERFRGHRIASRLLDDLAASGDTARTIETTITDDNEASQRLFKDFARRWGKVPVKQSPLFEEDHFPDGHDAEPLYEIGPFHPASRP